MENGLTQYCLSLCLWLPAIGFWVAWMVRGDALGAGPAPTLTT